MKLDTIKLRTDKQTQLKGIYCFVSVSCEKKIGGKNNSKICFRFSSENPCKGPQGKQRLFAHETKLVAFFILIQSSWNLFPSNVHFSFSSENSCNGPQGKYRLFVHEITIDFIAIQVVGILFRATSMVVEVL
jgi:hypothetical protein